MSNLKTFKKVKNDDIIKKVALHSSLTQPQVKQCIDIMFAYLKEYTLHPDCPTTFEFKLGDVGKLVLSPHSGRKAGVYKRPDGFGKGEMIEEIVEVEEPSYQNLIFCPSPSYKNKLKEVSKKRSIKQGWKARNGKIIPIDEVD